MPPTQKTWITRFTFGAKSGFRFAPDSAPAAAAFALFRLDNASHPKPAPVSSSSRRRDTRPPSLNIKKLVGVEYPPAKRLQPVPLDQGCAACQFIRPGHTAESQREGTLHEGRGICGFLAQTFGECFGLPVDERIVHQA